MNLRQLPIGQPATIDRVDGSRRFRLRLLELGLVPGTSIRTVRIAPLGDPLEIQVRGGRLSIRKAEAQAIQVHT
ncbi:MAG: ferrous iron transport protein A [Proteobacteria bacterium]|nr:ferrous iron transport protein A [Pseudomonadota bacterium]MCP4916814.1 ferrous iron transport protein A [Pseudomonadota bacterium]